MDFFISLFRKLGFIGGEEDDRSEEMEENELEDEEEPDEEDENEDEEENEGGRIHFRFPFGGRNKEQSFQEEDEEEEPEPREHHTGRTSRRSNVIHDSRMEGRAAQEPQFKHYEHIIHVRQLNECRTIISYLLNGDSILLNLENIDPKDCGRVVDFLSGAAFALHGRMVKVAHLSYLIAPESVKVIEEDIYDGASNARYR